MPHLFSMAPLQNDAVAWHPYPSDIWASQVGAVGLHPYLSAPGSQSWGASKAEAVSDAGALREEHPSPSLTISPLS